MKFVDFTENELLILLELIIRGSSNSDPMSISEHPEIEEFKKAIFDAIKCLR